MRLLDVIPLSGNGGGISIDDDDFIRRKVDEFASTLNINHNLRDWNWTDPIREGTAGVVHRLDNSNMENERLQSLVGLNDAQFIEAVRSGRVKREEWPLGKMPQAQRDALLQAQIARRNQWQQSINDTADYIMPEPHSQPEGILETAAYEILKVIPGAVEAATEYAIANSIPFGKAALFFKSVLEGSQNAQEQVYSNVRSQGKSTDEARQVAMSPSDNIADLGIRGVTQAATINALGQIPTATGIHSPIAQVAGNIARGAAYSGTGAMGESALTDVRSGNDINAGTMAKKGAVAAGATGILGLFKAARQGRRLWQLQKEYYANRPIEPDFREIPPDNPALSTGDNPATPPDNPNSPDSNAINTPEISNQLEPSDEQLVDKVTQWNNAVTKRGFEPVSDTHSIDVSFKEVESAIQYGQLSPQDAKSMIAEAGLSVEVADGMINAGIQARKNDLRSMYGTQVHNGMSKPEVDVISPLKQDTWVDPMTLGHGNPPAVQDNPFRSNIDVLGGLNSIERSDVEVLGGITPPEVSVNNMDIPKLEAPEAHSLLSSLSRPATNTLSLDDPLLAPPAKPDTGQNLLDALNGTDIAPATPTIPAPEQPIPTAETVQTPNTTPLMALEPKPATQNSIMPYPAPAPFDPHGAPYEIPTHTISTVLQLPSILGGIPDMQKPDVLGGITQPDVQVSGGVSQIQKPEIHSWTPLQKPNVHTVDFPKRPRVHRLDINDPLLAPQDYSKNAQYTDTQQEEKDDDGFIGQLSINHMGRERNLDVYSDEFNGKPYIDIADENGNSIAIYSPDDDVFQLREEVQRQGWARHIEGELRKHLPELLKKAGIISNTPNYTPIKALDTKKTEITPENEQTQSNTDNTPTPNHTQLTALEPETETAQHEAIPKGSKLKNGSVTIDENAVYDGYKPSVQDRNFNVRANSNNGILTFYNAANKGSQAFAQYDANNDTFTMLQYTSSLYKPLAALLEQAFRKNIHSFYSDNQAKTESNNPEPLNQPEKPSATEPEEETQQEQPKPAQEKQTESEPYSKIASKVKDFLEEAEGNEDAQSLSNKGLFTLSDGAFGGTQGQGKYTPKDAYDAMELGINMYIKEKGYYGTGGLEDGYQVLDALEGLSQIQKLLPTQRNRTDEQNEFQQFSTPPVLAYIANWLANILPSQVVLEPSAGLGGLAVFADASEGILILNELSKRRADLLDTLGLNVLDLNDPYGDGKALRENAEHIGNILAPKIKEYNEKFYDPKDPDDRQISVERVIMNPPFSSTAGRIKGQRDTKNAIRHVEQALQVLKPNGRLVAILGKGMADDAPAFRYWWKHIKRKYNVRANISIDGSNYLKYGTTFGNVIVVIDNNGATPKDGTFTASYGKLQDKEDFANLINDLAGIQQDIPDLKEWEEDNFVFDKPDFHIDPEKLKDPWNDEEDEEQSTNEDKEPETAEPKPTPATEAKPKPEEQENSQVHKSPETATTDNKTTQKPQTEQKPEAPAVRTETTSENKPKPAAQTKPEKSETTEHRQTQGKPETSKRGRKPKTEKKTEPKVPSTSIADIEAISKTGLKISVKSKKEIEAENKSDNENSGKQIPKDTADDVDAPDTEELSINSRYHSQFTGFAEHPGILDESTAMRSVEMPPASYIPILPAYIQEHGLISNAQIVPVVYAGQSFRYKNPDGSRRGFFIGDGTGVGKGREISAIIMDALAHGYGKGKAVWISDKHSLIKDAKRDWAGLRNNPDDVFAQEHITDKKLEKRNKGIIFTAYSYMKKARIEQLKHWLGEDFDGVIVLDECHNVNNVLPQKKAFGATKAAVSAINTMDFVDAFPNARVLYVSATGATEVRNLAMLKRLGLWGNSSFSGNGFSNASDFVSSISKGGTAAMELTARDLKAMGLFCARTLSMDGVTFRTLQHDLTPHQTAVYDTLAECWQIIHQNIDTAIALCGGEESKGIGSAISKYWGANQRFFNQIIITLQTPAMIQDIEKQLEAGKSIVIQLTNTFEANQNDALDKLKQSAKEGEEISYEDLDISPKEVMLNFLNACFPVQMMEEYEDEDGKIKTRPVLNSQGKPVESQEAKRMRDELIAKVNSIKQFPESPLDLIINYFGPDSVAEVTGRSRRFIFDPSGKRVEDKRNEGKIQAEINDFNEGRKRILIFSEKGGTGASYHASNDYPNKQKRVHYLLQAGWRADKAMQGLGRTHRSNEAYQPEYVLVTTDVPGQKRFLSTIARRLEQLGALTTGERKSTTQGLFSEDDNLEADYVQDAVKQLFLNIIGGEYPEFLNPDEVFEQLGFDPEIFSSGSNKNIPDVTRFLNRILSMKVDEQKKLFERFNECSAKNKEIARTLNKLDMRTESIRADKINILQETTITRSREYGTETKYVELELVKALNPRTWDNVMSKKPSAFYLMDTGEIVAAVPLKRSKTEIDTGITSQAFTLYYVNPRKGTTYTSDHILNNQSPRQLRHFSKLNEADAKRIWHEQITQLPPTYSEKRHMITGVLLPIWKRLGTSNLRVQRVTTDEGKTFLGRIIPEKELKETLSKLNIQYDSSKKYSTKQVLSELDKQGMVATLSNNLKLTFSRVNGEKRLEILNFDFFQEGLLVKNGCIKEYINNKPRIFLPAGNMSMLETLLNENPVVRIAPSRYANDIMEETADDINSEIPDSNNLYAVHPFFRPAPDDNPYINTSSYAFDDPETEKRYQSSKKVKKERLLDSIANFAHDAVKGWISDFPELAGDKKLVYAQELLRKLNRERKADVQETVKRMRAITHRLNNDDFDLFSRAMQLLDLHETLELDDNASLPWGFSTDSLETEYKKIMKEVDRNHAVSDAIEKAEILGRELSDDLANAAEALHLYNVRDKLKREHYFRHVVLDYFNHANGGSRATLRNPTRRGYLKHRKGSEKDISSDWITAMGEVWARMNGDIKILHTLARLRKEYDIVEDLKQQAFTRNKDEALYQLMDALKDNYSNHDDLQTAANSQLNSILNKKLSQSVTRLFKLAKKGELPEGDDNQWRELVYAMTLAGTLEQLPPKYRNDFTRYVGWLAGLNDTSRAKATAQRFLRSGLHKDRNLKNLLGDKFTTWQDLVPDDYDIWTPFDSRLVFSVSSVPENVMKIAEQNIDELLGMPLSELGNALSMGGDKQLWVIPSALAKTLNDMGKSTPAGLLGTASRKAMSAFKSWVLFSPVGGRVFKYNWRNFFGDLEAVLQGNPEALMYLRKAFNELKKLYIDGGEATGMLAQFQKRGGALTAESREELLHNWEDLQDFANLLADKKHVSPLKMTLDMFKGYMKMAGKLTEFREAILRYAAFLAYSNMLQENNGNPAFYGMSKPDEVNALKDDIYDMAFKMANENLGAYDQISQNTKWLRDNSWLSFISWVEVNFRRSIQMYKNIWSGNSFLEYWLLRHGGGFINRFNGGGNGNKPPKGSNGSDWDEDDSRNFRKILRRLGKSPVYAMRFAISLALAAPLMLILSVFNWLNGENDEKLSPDVRAQPHLTLNTNEYTGEVLYFNRLGSAFDFFETIGADTLPRDLKELFDGRITFTELANRITDGPISKLVNNFNPFFKAAVELLTGRKLYPDIEHPTNIRDNWEYVAQSLGLDWYYKMLTGKPHTPAWDLSGSVANTQKPDEAAYWYILSRKKEFQEQQLGRVYDGFTQTKQGEALYNARTAAHFGNRKMIRKYLKEFYRAGGVTIGLEASVRAMNPMYGLNDDEELRFLKWLPKDERKILRKALKFYERMKATLSI